MDHTKKDLYTAKRPSGLDTTNEELQPAIEQLRSDSDPTNWLILKVKGTSVVVHGLGAGGLSEFSSALDDEDVYYGVLRCSVDGHVRFFHVFFVGQHLSGVKKGKASLYKSAVFALVDAQGEIACTSGTEDYSDSNIISSIARLTRSTNIAF